MSEYHNALIREIESFRHELDNLMYIDTLYIGGGTPSTYPDLLLIDLFAKLREFAVISDHTEVTIEVNPGTVHAGQLALWQSLGINRLSIGVQSLKDPVLHSLNRLQSAHSVITLLEQARDYVSNISIDLILGLPGVSHDEWRSTLDTVVTWPITHISVYFLTIHEDTPLYFKVKNNTVTLLCDDSMIQLYHESRAVLKAHGFEHYEVSSFARPGYQSRHNTVYWERIPYKAFGLGACSFDGTKRFQNQKNLMSYIKAMQSGQDGIASMEELTERQIALERIMLGLRRSKGVNRDIIEALNANRKAVVQEKIEEFKRNQWMCERDGMLSLTAAGFVLENEIIVQLCE